MTTVGPTTHTPPVATPQPATPAPAPAKNDHDGDDGVVKPGLDKGVGEQLDQTA